MTKAYVLIKTEVGKTEAVKQAILGRSGVKAADVIIGPYDIIAIVQAEDLNGVGRLVLNQIHNVAGVDNTITCPVVG